MDSPRKRSWLLFLLLVVPTTGRLHGQDQDAEVDQRIADAARYLASDELEGRGAGSKGIDLAADYIARRFVEASLKTDLFDAAPMQKFTVPGPVDAGPPNLLHWLVVAALARPIDAQNVVAVLEGTGPKAEETIVIGAHYDHLGAGRRGAEKAEKPDPAEIYHGADDNASGVAVLIEVARWLAQQERLPRRVIVIAFTCEERGLLGSAHYVAHPWAPLEKTIVMFNLDMVGRLRDDKLTVCGTGSADGLGDLLDQVDQRHGLTLVKQPSGNGPSDHAVFYRAKVPVIHFFTDTHENLHRPSDTFETLNVPGMRRVARFVEDVVVTVAKADARPQYVDPQPAESGAGK